ncbi:MAG: histidine phosphatase family protein [Phycisphaerae bacterium]
MKIALIPVGDTEWQRDGRLLGRVELPLLPEGAANCAEWAQTLREAGVSRILHAPDELSSQTAKTVGGALGVSAKAVDELAEVDVGLWVGLTRDQLETRYESAYHELLESPLSVAPPGGEAFVDALERLRSCLRRRIKRTSKGTLGVVLRPLALALTRLELEKGESAKVWEWAWNEREPRLVEYLKPDQE